MVNRQRGTRLLRSLTVAYALPDRTFEFSLQVVDLTQGWSDAMTEQIAYADLLAMVAAVYIHLGLRFTTKQRHTGALSPTARGLCSAATKKISRRSSPSRRTQQVAQQEICPLQQLGYELAILTPTEWMELFQLRCTVSPCLLLTLK